MSAYANAQELIKAAYSNLGIVDVEGELSPALYEQGRLSLNAMLGSWSRKRLVVQGIVTESFALTPSQETYTIGTGGNFNTLRPISIIDAFIRDASSIDYPVQIITREQYNSISVKTATGRPEYLYYEPLVPLGNVRLFFVPDTADTLWIDSQKVITEFATIEDAITLPPEYEEAIEFNLSIRLAPKTNTSVPPEVAAIAASSYGVISLQPVQPAHFDGAFRTQGTYNIYSDNF